MSWLTIPTGKAEAALDLSSSESMLRVLAQLEEQTGSLENKSAIELLDMLMDAPDKYTQSIGKAVAIISGRPVDDVMAEWAELKSKYEGEQVQRLILLSRTFDQIKADTLGLDKTIDWKPLDRDINKSRTANPEVTLNVHAASKARFEFEALAAAPTLPDDITSAPGSRALMRVGFDGSLSVGAKAGVTGGPMLVDVSGSAAGEVEADLYFLETGDTSFGAALADDLHALIDCEGVCSPFQAEDLARLFYEEGLYCMSLRAQGTLAFGAAVSLGRTFNIGNEIKAGIGANVSYRMTNTGTFDYLLAGHEVAGEPAIAIQIKRARGQQRVTSEALALELDPRELARSLTPIIEQHLGRAQNAVDQFRAFLPGSDLVTTKLSDVIDTQFGSDPALTAMIRSLVGLDPDKTPEQVLRDLIIGKVETSAEAWSNDLQSAVGAITEDILRALPSSVVNAPVLRDKVADAVEKALTERRRMLADQVSEKVTSTDEYQALAEVLNEAGAGLAQTVDDVETGIARVRTAVQGILDRLQKRIDEMRSHLEAATEKTVKLRIASEHTDEKKNTLDLRFDLFPGRAGAQEVLSAILVGDMNRVMAVINSQGEKPAAVAHSGSLTIYQGTRDESATDLVLWNIMLGSKGILDAEVKWVVGVDGTITVTSKASYQNQLASLKEQRTVNFVEAADLLFAKNKRALSVGLTISNEDEQMSAEEVSAFFEGVVARKLLPPAAVDRALELFHAAGERKVKKGRLDIGLTLNTGQLERMLSSVDAMRTQEQCAEEDAECRRPGVQCTDSDLKPGCVWVLETIAAIQAEVFERHHSDRALVDRLHKIVDTTGIQGGLAGAIKQMTAERTQDLWGHYNQYEDDFSYSSQFGFLQDLSVVEYRRYGAMAMYEILAHMKALADTTIGTASVNDGEVTVEGWTPDNLQAQQYRISQLMPYWWYWSHEWENWAFLSDKMRATNIALLESWVELARGPDGAGPAPVVWASISLPGPSGKLVPTLLT